MCHLSKQAKKQVAHFVALAAYFIEYELFFVMENSTTFEFSMHILFIFLEQITFLPFKIRNVTLIFLSEYFHIWWKIDSVRVECAYIQYQLNIIRKKKLNEIFFSVLKKLAKKMWE